MARSRNKTFIISLMIVVIVLCFIGFRIKANSSNEQQQHAKAQLNPQTNDFNDIRQFKNDYVGNNSNDGNLNANLPLANVPHTFMINATTRELEIHYTKPVQDIGMAMSQFQASLVYNATANFALIGNLNAITFVFPSAAYHVTRAQVESWYHTSPSNLASKSLWAQDVQRKLSNLKYVNNAFQAFYGGKG